MVAAPADCQKAPGTSRSVKGNITAERIQCIIHRLHKLFTRSLLGLHTHRHTDMSVRILLVVRVYCIHTICVCCAYLGDAKNARLLLRVRAGTNKSVQERMCALALECVLKIRDNYVKRASRRRETRACLLSRSPSCGAYFMHVWLGFEILLMHTTNHNGTVVCVADDSGEDP